MTDLKTYNYIYQKYKNTILFNKNLILSGIAAFFTGAIFTQLFAEHIPDNNLLNTLFTLSFEYGVYIPLFAVLFYLDNRHRYIRDGYEQRNGRSKKLQILSRIYKALLYNQEIVFRDTIILSILANLRL